MAIETEEAEKKSDNNAPPPIAEVLLDTSDLNVDDKTTEAESSMRSFIGERLEQFHAQVEGAIDSLEQFILSQSGEGRTAFDTQGAFEALGRQFMGELAFLAGGPGAPIMDAINRSVYDTLSFAQHAEADAQGFLYHMRRSIRDAAWFVRDNISAILRDQWLSLVKLGYEGAEGYIGPLLQLGLPSVSFDPALFADKLVKDAEGFRDAHVTSQQQVVETLPAEKAEEPAKLQEAVQQEKEIIQEEQKAQVA